MKKVFIGVIAALVLFAFVACENSPVQDYKVLSGITGETDAYYLEGETPNVADFTFYKVYSDFTKEKVTDVENIELGKVGKDGSVSVEYNGISVTTGAKVNVIGSSDIVAGSFKVNAENAKTEYYNALTGSAAEYKSFIKDGLTATFEYTVDGQKISKTVKDDMLTIAADDVAIPTTATSSKAITVNLNGVTGISADYNVVVKNNGVKALEAVVPSDYVYYIGGTIDDSKVYVNLVYDSGERIKATSNDVHFDASATGQFTATDYTSFKPTQAGTFTFYAKYSAATPNYSETITGSIKNIQLTVNVANDSVVSISAKTTGTLTIGAKVNTLTNVTVTPVMASTGKDGTALTYDADGTTDATYSFVNGEDTFTAEAGYVAGNWVNVTVKSNGTGKQATFPVKLAAN